LLISRLCESFGCRPSEAEDELERNPELVMDVLLVRNYVETSQAINRAKTEADVPKGPLVDVWADIELELMQERQRSNP
jgi:hypothetical protein